MTKYALLFSGGINARYNYNRYANDLGFAYKVLTEKLQYLPQNITVMYSDGTPINYDNITINTTIATKDKFLLKIADYTQQINQNDFFTFIASNHGDKNGELCTWHDNSIERTEFINAIENIECLKIIIMGQCYGGNYTDSQNKIKNSVVLSANVSDQPSYGKIAKASNGKYVVDKNNDYDEFLYNFFSYYNESYPCGKPLNSTKTENTLLAAYEYAKNNDFWGNGIYLDGKTTT